jgi:histidinol-phosphatase (PHP family)
MNNRGLFNTEEEKNVELVNTHCHCVYSGHGIGAIAEYAEAANNAGVSLVAFTEHFPLSSAFDPDCYLSMQPKNVSAYFEEIEEVRQRFPHIEFVIGTEIDYLHTLEDRTINNEALESFAFTLGSVHFIDGWAFDDPAQKYRWEEPGAADVIWKRYGELWCEAASNKALPYDVMAHPDLAKKFGYYPSFNLQPLYKNMAEAAEAGGRMVEVNTSGAHYACGQMFPAPDLLKEFCRAGIPCTVGCDSHDPVNIARGIRDAYQLMYEAGYREVTVPTATGERRRIAIE